MKLWEEIFLLVMNRVKCIVLWVCMIVSCGNDLDGIEKRLFFEFEGVEKLGGR